MEETNLEKGFRAILEGTSKGVVDKSPINIPKMPKGRISIMD